MVRTSKSAEKPVVVAPVVDVPAAKPRAKKVKAEAEAAPVVEAAAPAVAPVVEAAPVDPNSTSVKLTELSAKVQQIASLLSALKSDLKNVEKNYARDMKAAQKASAKKRRNNGNRKPSGFVKPTRISDELASFLGKPVGTEMARTEVSKEINSYITSNSLQDKTNGRKIIPDVKLTQLLKIGKDDELTYFNLQRFMKHHFIKAEVVVATA
jgi:chromatin remodeling complex protein RSC6